MHAPKDLQSKALIPHIFAHVSNFIYVNDSKASTKNQKGTKEFRNKALNDSPISGLVFREKRDSFSQ